jgi:hypothetical protein
VNGFKKDEQIQPPPRRFFPAEEGGDAAAGIDKPPPGIGRSAGNKVIQIRDEFRPGTPELGTKPEKKQHLYHGKSRYSIPDVQEKDKSRYTPPFILLEKKGMI